MKRLVLILAWVLPLMSGAQSLVNTTWLGTNPPSPNLWMHFGTDSIYFSFGTGYNALGVYSASAGQFAIFDNSGASLCTDTGFYNYSVTSTNLVFTVISDACSSRRNTLTQYTWHLLSTGLDEAARQSFTVYPNPCRTELTIAGLNPCFLAEFFLYDMNGKKVGHQKVDGSLTIDVSFLAPGRYTGCLQRGSECRSFSIIKE